MPSDSPLRIDLHCHTTASDGRLTPTELVARAAESDVDVIAVSDHDTVAGIEEARTAGAQRGVEVIASIELSARDGARNVHVLGPFIDHSTPALLDTLSSLSADRVHRAEAIVKRLCEMGLTVTMDEVREQASAGGGIGIIARPHIARALVARGHITAVRDAFTPALIADGGAADVPKETLSPIEAVLLIRSSGGVPVVAHPGVGHHDGVPQALSEELLAAMAEAGMAGMEIDHPDHPPLMREQLAAVAERLGLIQTGGSDFHGDEGHVLCRGRTMPEALAALRSSATRPA